MMVSRMPNYSNVIPPPLSSGQKVTEATTVERQEREPIIRETIIPEERIEVQPVVHREREVLEVYQVTQPVYEKQIRETRFESSELPAEYREKVEGSQADFQDQLREGMEDLRSSVHRESVERQVIDQPAIIHETVKKVVRQEVQPIIYREVHEPRVIRETLPIYERVVEAPRVFREQREAIFKEFPAESFRLYTTQSSQYQAPVQVPYKQTNYQGQTQAPLYQGQAQSSYLGQAQSSGSYQGQAQGSSYQGQAQGPYQGQAQGSSYQGQAQGPYQGQGQGQGQGQAQGPYQGQGSYQGQGLYQGQQTGPQMQAQKEAARQAEAVESAELKGR